MNVDCDQVFREESLSTSPSYLTPLETPLKEKRSQNHPPCDDSNLEAERLTSDQISIDSNCENIGSVCDSNFQVSTLLESSDSYLSDLSDDDDGSQLSGDFPNSDCKTLDGDSDTRQCVREYVWEKKECQQKITGTVIPNDIKYHRHFKCTCRRLCDLTVAVSSDLGSQAPDSLLPLTSSNLQAVTAKELLPQLDLCYVYMHGGRALNRAQVLCFPHYPNFRDVIEENFRDCVLYLTNLVRKQNGDDGFVLIVDRRKDKWTSLRKLLIRLTTCFPGDLKMILVLRSARFLQRKAADMGFWLRRDQLMTKVPIVMLSSTLELRKYISADQLPAEFGGTYHYDHTTWLRNRMLVEDFTSHAIDIGRNLDAYGIELENTELPIDVPSTQYLMLTQKESAKYYKEKIDGLMETAITLKSTINISCTGNTAAEGNYSLEIETLQNIISIIEEVDATFYNCWLKHDEKLRQCLEIRQFEQDYQEAVSKLTIYQQWCYQQSDHVGTSSSWVEYLINESERMRENFMESNVEYSLLTTIGGGMIEASCYVSSFIASKCNELEDILTDLNEAFERRIDFLTEVRAVLVHIEELNSWCDKAMSLLAGQGIEKAQSLDGAQQAIFELENFFHTNARRGLVKTTSSCESLENYMNAVNSRYEEAMMLYEKRRAYFTKTVNRYHERPVQRVEPSVKTSAPSSTSRKSKSSSGSNYVNISFDPKVQLRHVMNELLSTEEIYVKELKGILEGYGKEIDEEANNNLVPKELRGKTEILLGNMEEIHAFHSKIFLKELEECKNTPALVGKCFVEKKDSFDIYAKYCQNSAKSEELRSQIGEQHPFLLQCQRKLGHVLPLSAYLLKPIQRITKYQLILKEMLKYSKENIAEMQAAFDTMLSVLKSVNDSMHKSAIVGYPEDLDKLGALILQGPFSVQMDHKKVKVKTLARNRFNKSSQRHLFLFEKELLFCKLQNVESNSSDNNFGFSGFIAAASSGGKKQCYFFKNSVQMCAVEVSEKTKSDAKKLEILHQGREIYTLLAVSASVKHEWAQEMKKIIAGQPKDNSLEQKNTDKKKLMKARRHKGHKKKSRSAVINMIGQSDKDHQQEGSGIALTRVSSVGKSGSVNQESINRECIARISNTSNENQLSKYFPLKPRRSASLPTLFDLSFNLFENDRLGQVMWSSSELPFTSSYY